MYVSICVPVSMSVWLSVCVSQCVFMYVSTCCRAHSRALISLCRKLPYPRPVCCPCFLFWVFTDLSCFTGSSWTPAFCLTCGPGDTSMCLPFSSHCISSSLHFDLHNIKRLDLLDPHASASFAFGSEKDILDSLYALLSITAIGFTYWTCYMLLSIYSWHWIRITFRSLPTSVMWSRNPWCPPRETDHFWTLVSQLCELCPNFYYFVNWTVSYHFMNCTITTTLWTVGLWTQGLALFWYFVFTCWSGHVSILTQILILV